AVPALGAGVASVGATSLTLPVGTAAGTYYVLARADGEGSVPETNESNNSRVVAIALGGDLAVTTLTVPATAGAGATVTGTDTTKNQGGGVVGATPTRFYLSDNAVFDASDVLLGERAVPALGVDAVSTANTSLVIPATTSTGSYYVVARADDAGL